jgi:HD-GYP domain-containing protein (c-di-GMP phosphodiesterase class II)
MKLINLSTLLTGSTAQTDYFSEKGELLISKGTVITQRHLDILMKRNNYDLYVKPASEEEEISSLLAKGITKLDALDLSDSERKAFVASPPEAAHVSDAIDVRKVKPGKAGLIELSKSEIASALDEGLTAQSLVDTPQGKALKDTVSQLSPAQRSEEYKGEVSTSYQTALAETEQMLRLLAGHKKADASAVARIVQRFVQIFISDRNILLNISSIKAAKGDYLFHHSLNVCLLSINVAASYGYNEQQVLEIGMGALLHDIGMLLIADSIRTKHTRLTEDEWYEIQKHPILGLHLLEELKRMPDKIPYVAYQVHERENGTGYPRQRNSLLIHRYAKMVQVADIYEALTSPRPHRPAFLPCQGIYKIIQMARGGLISSEAVKALLEYVSLFPVGSLVELSNHCIAKVVHAHKTAFHQPTVSVLLDERGKRIDKKYVQQIDLTQHPAIQIIKALPADLIGDISLMDGF